MNIPQGFIDEIASYGCEALSGLTEALSSTEPEVSVRVNRAKEVKRPEGADPVKWCDEGFYLAERPQFTFDPAMHQGLYYVQDASSMAIVQAIKHILHAEGSRPLIYLDACAAPGGKTTAAISMLPAESIVLANEYDFRRAAVLAENLAKWGSPNVMVTRGDTARLSNLRECFDVIAADVPCSGEGMMRKDAEAAAQWSQSLVSECVERQREIVNNLWDALRPGGWMIYSTCTFNRDENEEMVEYICDSLGGETVDIGLDNYEGVIGAIASDRHCYRYTPSRVRGEGLFMSVIRKNGDKPVSAPKASKKPVTVMGKAPAESKNALDWLKGSYELIMLDDRIVALPDYAAKWMHAAATWVDVVSAGVSVATIKGRDVIPNQDLALSRALNTDAFPTVEVDYPTAIAYLRREAISVDAPRGYVLLTFEGQPLGFVKNLGNRANNLYPQAWRILSPNTPERRPSVI